MTIHNLRDYSPATKTAANRVYPPDAPMAEWADPDDYADQHAHRVQRLVKVAERANTALMAVAIGVAFAVMLAVAVL